MNTRSRTGAVARPRRFSAWETPSTSAGISIPNSSSNVGNRSTPLNNLLMGEVSEDVERIADDLAVLLHEWREETGDVCPWSSPGPRILHECTESYVEATVRALGVRPTARSPIGIDRGLREVTGSKR